MSAIKIKENYKQILIYQEAMIWMNLYVIRRKFAQLSNIIENMFLLV